MNKVMDVLVKWFKDRGCAVESSLGYGSDTYKIMIEGECPNRFDIREVVVYNNKDMWIWGLGSPNALSKNIDPHKVMHLSMDDPELFIKLGLLFPSHKMPVGDIIGGIMVLSVALILFVILIFMWLRIFCLI